MENNRVQFHDLSMPNVISIRKIKIVGFVVLSVFEDSKFHHYQVDSDGTGNITIYHKKNILKLMHNNKYKYKYK